MPIFDVTLFEGPEAPSVIDAPAPGFNFIAPGSMKLEGTLTPEKDPFSRLPYVEVFNRFEP